MRTRNRMVCCLPEAGTGRALPRELIMPAATLVSMETDTCAVAGDAVTTKMARKVNNRIVDLGRSVPVDAG